MRAAHARCHECWRPLISRVALMRRDVAMIKDTQKKDDAR